MNIKRFIINDIKRSIIHNKYRIVMCAGIILALMTAFNSYANVHSAIRNSDMALSFYDYVLYMIRGVVKVTEQNINKLDIPFVWISLCIMNGIMVLDYLYNDMKGIGRNVLLYSQKKSMWWISKCITTVVSVSIVYILIYFFAFIFTVISKGGMTGVHTDIFRMMYGKETAFMPSEVVNVNDVKVLLYVILFPWIISVCIGLFQVALGIYVGPVLSFILILIIDGMSIFSNNILLWGNWFMAERCDILVNNGFNCYIMFLIAVMVGILSVIAGFVRFRRIDII